MAENSKIEWTDHTVNLWWGCAKVHTGCKNCYAEHLSDVRYQNNLWGEKGKRKRIKSAFKDLDKYQKKALKANEKHKVFVGSMMDIFEDNKPLVNPEHTSWADTETLRMDLFERIDENWYPNLIFLFLTKRPTNIVHMIPNDWINNTPKNVWFGTSVSNMETWKYAESLKLVSNTNLFLSIEPQVGLVTNVSLKGFQWIIQGGESGSKKRPFDLEWAYRLKRMCERDNVPYFFKQIDKVQQIPKDLMIREFPVFKKALAKNI